MSTTQPHPASPVVADGTDPRLRHLREVIGHAAHLLPAQGPITVFVHHNTLHAFEDLPFAEAVKKGGQVFGCQPYLAEDRYRDELRRGRIRFAELQQVLEEDLGPAATTPVPCFGTRLELQLAMLQYPLRFGPTEELVWYVAETNGLRRVRDETSAAVRARLVAETRRWVVRDLRGGIEPLRAGSAQADGAKSLPAGLAELLGRFGPSAMEHWSDEDWEGFTLQALWRLCCDGVRDLPAFVPPPHEATRHRDWLREATGVDADELVHEHFIKFCSAFSDQGLAHWALPRRDEGFYRSFLALYGQPGPPADRWMRGLVGELTRLEREAVGPLESIRASLDDLGVAESEWEEFVGTTLLALRGWGGMARQLEVRGDRVVHPAPPGTLVEFLAVRLILERFALAFVARESLGYTGPLAGLRDAIRAALDRPWPPTVEQRAFALFQLAQIVGLSPDVLHHLGPEEWRAITREVETFTALERRRIFHLAYERRFYTQALDAVALHARRSPRVVENPRFQAVFCIDEREESIRRQLEELAPDAETFGTAGFFSVAMYFKGVDDAHFVPLCPAIIVPQHWVAEEVVEGQGRRHRRSQKTRRALGRARHTLHVGTRSLTLGALLAGVVGVLASIPLIARTLFPRLTSRVRGALGRIVATPRLTRLQLERADATPGREGGGLGFKLDEMARIAEKVLRDIGLTSRFSRVVLVIGHGSTSMNNPHESAHDCGACGGARGGPNARALAQMLNDPRVREQLAGKGLAIPPETAFLGAMHNTSNDSVAYYDLDLLPGSHRQEFEAIRGVVDAACDRDAHERSRRFASAPLSLTFAAARQHVEGRAEDLAQVRPEWGHATNTFCIVGRRSSTRGLFLDRRAFLTSYDPTQDDAEQGVLLGILSAVFPVCAGINLEYYFSYVDNTGWGCGTKLPHNVTGLLGVMDGAESDLRTGLPWQMVEIHEPVRILFIIETTPEAMTSIMDRVATIGRLCRNEWVRVAVLHPVTREIRVFRDGEFRPYAPQASELPHAVSSVDWYRGWRDHLEFAEIGARGGT